MQEAGHKLRITICYQQSHWVQGGAGAGGAGGALMGTAGELGWCKGTKEAAWSKLAHGATGKRVLARLQTLGCIRLTTLTYAILNANIL